MNAQAPLVADRAVVRAFLERINAHAAAAFAGIHQPGMLQLVRIHPGTEDTLPFRFAIGEVDLMADEAVRQANAGNNVYIEARTVAKNAAKRGSIADTVGVFGLVNDADADKGRAGHLTVEPSLVIETSPGNFHHWLLLDRAVPAAQAKALGAAIRAKAGADAASGVLTQPYRIPGTPNFPGKRKLARGRVATQTGIVRLDGKVWTAAELRAAFPEPERPARPTGATAGEAGPTGRTSATAEAIAAETDAADRSERFFDAVKAAYADGLSPDDLDAVLRRHPDGCAGKYLEPYDRLRQEIDRAWEKVSQKAEEIRQAAENPAYEDVAGPVEDARRAVDAAVRRFLDAATAYRLAGDGEAPPPVHALNVTTGVGKTTVTARVFAEHILSRRAANQKTRPILYAVPTHRLGGEIERQFLAHGVTARVFRGRQAPDPDRLGQTMCDDLEAVEIALALGEPVSTSCCRVKPTGKPELTCEHFHSCSYQTQQRAKPDVWIVAHQMLFQAQTALGKIDMVVIDEGFWQTGLRIPKSGLTLDEIRAPLPLGRVRDDALQNDIEHFRGRLAQAMRAQSDAVGIGGVRRACLEEAGITGQTCKDAIDREWSLKSKATIFPGMSRVERRAAAKVASIARHVRGYVALWHGARELLYDETVEISGRLYLEHRDDDGEGKVVVAKARSIKPVAKAWLQPTLILDATLPAPEILRAFFEQVEIPAPVEAAMPHVRVRQVLSAPVASHKLRPAEGEADNRNLRAVRRAVLARFIENDRAPLLVIAQKAAADWLRGSGLPEGVAVEHFNNVAGLDRYRDVRGLMVIGRTIPSPVAVEALAGALTGREAATLPKGQWYDKAIRGLRTRDGRPAGIECDAHPDPVAEACRWQICEAEMLQAIGRARGVNRTPETPLSIDVLANVCLPLTVDEVVQWSPPGEEVEMLADGVVLDSGDDMAMAWPDLWGTGQAARHWTHRRASIKGHSVPNPYKNSSSIGIRNAVGFRYQRPGPRQKWRTGAYDPATVPDLQAWLESRLGPLAGLIFETAAEPPAGPRLPRAADYAPDLAPRYRCVVDLPARSMPTAPVLPEIIQFEPDADPARPGTAYRRLLDEMRSGRLAEMRRRYPPAHTEARP